MSNQKQDFNIQLVTKPTARLPRLGSEQHSDGIKNATAYNIISNS